MDHLHDYVVIDERAYGIRERCKRCGNILITKKGKGDRIDNRAYLKEHKRDFLQPGDPRFEREWGKPNYGKI